MKRYLTLLTVSFLSTSTLVKAGNFDIFNLPANPEEKASSLRAKAAKLQRNIDNTQNADLRDAFTRQQGVINSLINSPLTDAASDAYFEAQGQENKIKANFVQEVGNKTRDQQFSKIDNILCWGIYAPESQEFQDLEVAMQAVGDIFRGYNMTERELVKVAGHYLKKEKLITQHVQKADEIIDKHMADIKKIKGSGV